MKKQHLQSLKETQIKKVLRPVKILVNRAKCLGCDKVLTSSNVKTRKTCSCKNLQIFGGSKFLGRAFNTKRGVIYKELSQVLVN